MVIETASLANLSGAAVRNNSTFNPPVGSNVPLLRSVFPEIVETIRNQFRIPDGMLSVPMPHKVLNGPCILTIICQFETTAIAQHVRVNGETQLGLIPCPGHQLAHCNSIILIPILPASS